MKKLVSTLKLDKKEWLKYRKQGIGGSDAGAVCGLNPYRTAMQVYQDKVSEEIEEIDNDAMRQGREFEVMWREDLQKQLEKRSTCKCDVLSRKISVHVS